jgi:hypothetical protein
MAKMVFFCQEYIPPEANENWTPEFAAKIVRIFHQHFPNAKIDFDDEAYTTYYHIIEMAWPAWKHEDLGRQLDEIERALRVLSRVDDLPGPIIAELFNDAIFRSRGVEQRWGKISPSQAMKILPTLNDLLAPSLREAKKLVRAGYQGKTNWEAANAINGCRLSWRRCTGDEAPGGSDLDLASPFGEFVQDIFDALEIDGKPRSAMQAWNRVQSKDENT